MDARDGLSEVLATSASIKQTRHKLHVIQSTHTKYSREKNKNEDEEASRAALGQSLRGDSVAAASVGHRETVEGREIAGTGAEGVRKAGGVRYVRLSIHKPATEWGSSIWRLQLWGFEVQSPG